MADGLWRISRRAVGGKSVVDEIRVWWDPETDSEVPGSVCQMYALELEWPDGHIDFYPWCSILKVEYTPPTKDPA